MFGKTHGPTSAAIRLETQLQAIQRPGMMLQYMGVSKKLRVPQNGWFIMENPIFFNGWFGGKTHYFRKHPYVAWCFLQDLLSGSFFISKVSKMTFCSCFEPHRGRRLPSTRGLRHPPQLVLTEKSKHKRSTNTLFNTTSPLVPSFPPVHFSVINQHVDCATKNDIMGDQLTSHTLKILIKVQLILGSSGGVIHLIVKLIGKRPPHQSKGWNGNAAQLPCSLSPSPTIFSLRNFQISKMSREALGLLYTKEANKPSSSKCHFWDPG